MPCHPRVESERGGGATQEREPSSPGHDDYEFNVDHHQHIDEHDDLHDEHERAANDNYLIDHHNHGPVVVMYAGQSGLYAV